MKSIHVITAMFILLICTTQIAARDIGIPYQQEPRAGLTVGGQPTLDQLETLHSMGYTTVINLRRKGEFDDFDERVEVERLGMTYVHIPVKNVKAITGDDARALHEAIENAAGPVLLHCTVGWRAGGLLAIESYLLHDASEQQALELASAAHMSHATGDVEKWIQSNGR
jgi:uncharacterized protein (TIGR01244 family)